MLFGIAIQQTCSKGTTLHSSQAKAHTINTHLHSPYIYLIIHKRISTFIDGWSLTLCDFYRFWYGGWIWWLSPFHSISFITVPMTTTTSLKRRHSTWFWLKVYSAILSFCKRFNTHVSCTNISKLAVSLFCLNVIQLMELVSFLENSKNDFRFTLHWKSYSLHQYNQKTNIHTHCHFFR